MKDKPANVPASAAARLRNVARSKNTSFDIILKRYGLEGLIRRLSASPHRDNFILKGAMLFTVWLDDPFRPTQDLDLLGYGDSAVDTIANTFRQICTQDADDDGLIFDVRNLVAHAIREDQQYGGVRVRTKASLGKIQIPIQVDIGFGDVVTPQAVPVEFPALLSKSGPRIRAYPRESVIAEKLHAIISRGIANSRMKDFYDIAALSRLFPFDGNSLCAAIHATFERRATPIPDEVPTGLTIAFSSDHQKIAQWRAFTSREPLLIEQRELSVTIEEIAAFVMPPLRAIQDGNNFDQTWSMGGPWNQNP